MPIEPVGGGRPVDPIKPVSPKRTEKVSLPSTKFDKAEISDVAKYIAEIKDLPPVREEKIEQIRQQIANGDFDDPERTASAINRILSSLEGTE